METIQYIEKVSKSSGISVDEIMSKNRARDIVTAREMCCYVLHHAGYSLHRIGRAMGINHSTAYHSVHTFTALICSNDPLAIRYFSSFDHRIFCNAKMGGRICAF